MQISSAAHLYDNIIKKNDAEKCEMTITGYLHEPIASSVQDVDIVFACITSTAATHDYNFELV